MPENKINVANLLGIAADLANNTLTVRCRGQEGNIYAITIGAGRLGALVTGLTSQAARLPEAPAMLQPMTLTMSRPFTLADGRPGLFLQLDHGVHLQVLLPEDAIPVLQTSLAALQSQGSGKPKPGRH